MQLSNQDAERLVREAVAALQQGRFAVARGLLERVIDTGRANVQIWLMLASACLSSDDPAAAETALDRVMALEPRLVRAHIMKGDCRARAGDDVAAVGFYTSARMIADGQRVPDDLAAELARAAAAATQIKARYEEQTEAVLVASGSPPGSRSARFQQSLDIRAGRKQIFAQEPTGYYFPGLAPIQFFDTAGFDWVPAVEAATATIRDELLGMLATGTEGFRPYIRSDPNLPRLDDNVLLDNIDWSARFFCENGVENAATIARCPQTWAAIQAAPLPRIPNSPTVMFSLLRPGARIAPHTGTHNTRLVCHLPLVVPPGCRFRVGNEVREWEEGKVLIFDDTIEHEAWNDSDRDRVVLIFDIWRPDLSEQERSEIAVLLGMSAGETGSI